jgi:N-sulfoglucosamine sulfohydrolase
MPLRALLVALLLCAVAACAGRLPRVQAQPAANSRPNILWISAEDFSPDMGCYGDGYARTPNLDRLAAQGARYTHAFSVAPVCAPSRSAIITGMYPTTIGTMHMRSQGVPPPNVRCFTEYLRAAGYYCTNNVKTDYNFAAPLTAWDQNSNRAHWRGRESGQPFFAVFNLTVSHESQIRTEPEVFQRQTRALKPEERHDPAKAVLPPYYPDTPVVRNDWARYYDLGTAMDYQAGEILRQLEADGLADNTVVFFWGDHGRGLPRAKRWPYGSGTHVPLLVRWPGTIPAGEVRSELVSLFDLAPTALSIAGVKPPAHLQAQAFLGPHRAGRPREYVVSHRDRMDETYDIIRAVRDSRYRYIRNFQPQKPYAQYIDYMEKMPTMQELRRLNKEGGLAGPQRLFFLPEKPEEELYDSEADPHEVRNLAADPAHRQALRRLRATLTRWMKDTKDLGLVPEDELKERMRPGGRMAEVAAPRAEFRDGRLTLTCETEGASLAYTTQSGPQARWKLYHQPTPLPAGSAVRAVACRLGWKDSPEVRVTAP